MGLVVTVDPRHWNTSESLVAVLVIVLAVEVVAETLHQEEVAKLGHDVSPQEQHQGDGSQGFARTGLSVARVGVVLLVDKSVFVHDWDMPETESCWFCLSVG